MKNTRWNDHDPNSATKLTSDIIETRTQYSVNTIHNPKENQKCVSNFLYISIMNVPLQYFDL